MAYSDHIGQSGNTIFFYCRISGLPYIWSSIGLPAQWLNANGNVVIDGEEYAPQDTLQPGDEWAAVEDKAEVWNGLPTASQLDVTFQLPGTADWIWEAADVWLDIMAGSIKRGVTSVLVEDLTGAFTTAALDDTSLWDASGYAYVGLETIKYTGKTATELTGVTRAKFGSFERFHATGASEALETGSAGPYVSDHPLALAGRVLSLWVGTGFYDTRQELVPFGATAESDEDRMIYTGIIRDWEPDKALGQVTVQVEGERSELATEVGKRLPRATAYGSTGGPYYINADNNRISWRWDYGEELDFGTDPAMPRDCGPYDVRLQRDDGAGTSESVPDGWYSRTELNNFITWTMFEGLDQNGQPVHVPNDPSIGDGVPDEWSTNLWQGIIDDQVTTGLYVTTTGAGFLIGYRLYILGVNSRGSLWRMLGFTADASATASGSATVADPLKWVVYGDRAPAVWWLPAAPLGVGREFMYRWSGGPSFKVPPGWQDEDGQDTLAHVRIEDEIVSITAKTTTGSFPALKIGSRERFGSTSEEIYVEAEVGGGEELPELVQGLAFPRTQWGEALLYLATMSAGDGTNGSHDVGWRGGGAGVPVELIDVDSWTTVSRQTDGLRDISVWETTGLDEVMARNIKLSHAIIGARWSPTTKRFVLTAKDMRPVLAHEAVNAVELNASNLRTLDGPGLGWRVDESGVVNTIKAVNLGYDHGQSKARQNTTWKDATSAGTWTDSRPLEVDMQDVTPGNVSRGERALVDLAQRLSALYSRPFLVLILHVVPPAVGWNLELGDELRITHPLIVRRASVGRGVTELAARVYGVRKLYRSLGNTKYAARVIAVAAEDGARFAGYAPSALCWYQEDDTNFFVRDHWDSYEGDPKDITYFPAGSWVRCYNPGNESGAVMRFVTGTSVSPFDDDESSVSLNSDPGLAVPFFIEPGDYNDPNTLEEHRRYAYLAGSDGNIDRPPGEEPDDGYEYL